MLGQHVGDLGEARTLAVFERNVGGCFQNALLTESLSEPLVAKGHRLLLGQQIPCNDGGISEGKPAWRISPTLRAIDDRAEPV